MIVSNKKFNYFWCKSNSLSLHYTSCRYFSIKLSIVNIFLVTNKSKTSFVKLFEHFYIICWKYIYILCFIESLFFEIFKILDTGYGVKDTGNMIQTKYTGYWIHTQCKHADYVTKDKAYRI